MDAVLGWVLFVVWGQCLRCVGCFLVVSLQCVDYEFPSDSSALGATL